MGNLRTGHIVEAAIWLGVCIVLYAYTFEFDSEIEIYKFGASGWPRAILLLIAVAALGQLYGHYRQGDDSGVSKIGQASADSAAAGAEESDHNTLRWYLWTFGLLVIPFVYILVPDWIGAALSLDKPGINVVKLITGGVVAVAFVLFSRGNRVGGILTLPILFAAMLQDMGFYALAPVFILGVMYFMGERRLRRMVVIGLGLYCLLLLLFVSLLYVGLPTGNISPFYEIGTGMVNILQ